MKLDSHSQILQFPGKLIIDENFNEMINLENSSKIAKKFINLWQQELPSFDHFDDYLSGLPHVQSQLYYPVVDGLGLLSKETAREQMNKYDLRYSMQFMLGLPGETKQLAWEISKYCF